MTAGTHSRAATHRFRFRFRRHRHRSAGLLVCLLGLVASADALAHATGVSYLHIDATGEETVTATWDIAAADLELPLAIDSNADGEFSADEVSTSGTAISRFALERLAVGRGGVDCSLSPHGLTTTVRSNQTYVSLAIEGKCRTTGNLNVESNLFFGSVGYSLLIDAQTPHGNFDAALTMASHAWTEPPVSTWYGTLSEFLVDGIWHVAIGYDHIAFVLLLLLPSVLHGSRTGWKAATSLRQVAADLGRIVTAFTVAHSITLALAATGTVNVPGKPIEVAIAGSIVIAGLLNLFPAGASWRLRLAFGFGLVHGFGFANALRESGAGETRLLPMLAGFNLGVEVAQLTIVALTLPVLWRLSRGPGYAKSLLPALSVATAVTGAIWFANRL
jgi:hypothetical protein